TNGFSDIYVVDVLTGVISRESVSSTGAQANGSNFKPSISGDGRFVVFESNATNLVADTAVGSRHIYLRDRLTGVTSRVSQSSAGAAGNGTSLQAVINADGSHVAFASDASNLVNGDTNGLRDVFLRSVVSGMTTRVSVKSDG